MIHFMGVGIFRIGLNRPDLGCWRLILSEDGNLSVTAFRNFYLHSFQSNIHLLSQGK